MTPGIAVGSGTSDGAGVEILTAAEAEVAQARAAGALLAAGCHEGDRVVFCLPSSAALLCAVMGALRVGVDCSGEM